MGISKGVGGSKNSSWVWSVLPLNAGVQGFTTLAPLYILFLHGTVVDVGLITTLYNAVLIPASMFWGSMTDRLARRRLFFVICCAGTAVTFFIMYLLPDLGALAALYGILAVVVSANSTSANLLVMETSEKKSWMASYSRLALVSNMGSVLGLGVGFIWSSALPLGGFLLFCAIATAASLVLSFYLVPEPEVPLESAQLSFHPLGYASRIYHGMTVAVHHLIISPPSPKDVVKLVRATRAGAITGRGLLFLSTFFFTTGSAFLNTAFTPFLAAYGVSDSEVFAVSLINVTIQTLIYRGIGPLIVTFGGVRAGSYSILARTSIYMLFAFSALAFQGTPLFLVSIVAYSIAGVSYAIWNSSTSVALFSTLGQGRQGNLLGGYAAVSNLGTVVGSLFTGYVAYYSGYSTTFAVAAALMLVSFFVLEASLRSLGYTQGEGKGHVSRAAPPAS